MIEAGGLFNKEEYTDKLTEKNEQIEHLKKELAECRKEKSSLEDWCDLMVDEFYRIRALTRNPEIRELCERAIVKTTRKVSVIDVVNRQVRIINGLSEQKAKLQSRNKELVEGLRRLASCEAFTIPHFTSEEERERMKYAEQLLEGQSNET